VADQDGHPTIQEMDLGRVLAALSDPNRRRVVTELLADPSDAERSCASFELPVSKSTCTHHFRVLRESGLLRDVDYGNHRGVTLRRRELEERFPGLLGLLAHEADAPASSQPPGTRPSPSPRSPSASPRPSAAPSGSLATSAASAPSA
jgi:DNA-binding transcriptional ArsR family regulator